MDGGIDGVRDLAPLGRSGGEALLLEDGQDLVVDESPFPHPAVGEEVLVAEPALRLAESGLPGAP